eukprot:scaffold20524_cov85-Skeletonema_dohrnii-CCMP3373.AAC.4
MERRDCNYYEANAAGINMGEITSSAKNAKILQRLRDGDDKLRHLNVGRVVWQDFIIGEGDDLGWLGYLIGKSVCLQRLDIYDLRDGEEGHAFAKGIARSQSIRGIDIYNDLSNDAFTSIVRALCSLSQLEKLTIGVHTSVGLDGWSELGTLLGSGVCKLKQFHLYGNNYIGNEGMGVLSNGLRGIGSSLKVLRLNDNSIGNEGLFTLVEALQTGTSLEILNLSGNNFSSAAAGLGSLSDWLQRHEVNLYELNLQYCRINDEGLHVLAEGAAKHCEKLDLRGNEPITTLGLSYLSDSILSDSCRVKSLSLRDILIRDKGLEVLAQGLVGNQSLTNLHLGDLHDDVSITSAGWLAFSTALCDTSNVNSTYLSNHTIHFLCVEYGETIPRQSIVKYLRLNWKHPQYAARCKILMSHRHLNMAPFLHWGLKFLPLAVAWVDRAKPCTALTIDGYKPCTALTIDGYDPDLRILDESDEAFESRELTAMYEFVRGMPMEVMKSRHGLAMAAAYDKKIARIEEENKIALEQRDRKIEQLEEEIRKLRGW